MSECVVGKNTWSSQPAGVNTSRFALTVAGRTSLILLSKYWCRFAATIPEVGAQPQPNNSLNDRYRRSGCDWSALTQAVQKTDHLWPSSSMYWQRCARQAATNDELAVEWPPARRMALYSDRNDCFALRHLSSNHMHDGHWWHVMSWTGICWSKRSPIFESYRLTRALPSRFQCRSSHKTNEDRLVQNAVASNDR